MAKFGQRVYVKELDTYGVVYAMSSGKVTHVQTDDGRVIEVIDKTIVILTVLRKLWILIKNLIKLITVLVFTFSTFTVFGQNVKLRQIERTPVKWQVVSAFDSLGSSFALKYINLQDLIDTLNIDVAGNDSIYLQNDTIFLREGAGFVDLLSYKASIDTSKWTLTGNNLYPKSSLWKVGIGTTTPSLPLDVNGDALINGIRYGNAGVAPFTNIRIGNQFTLGSKTTGSGNIGIGLSALQTLTTGINNVAIGDGAGLSYTGNNLVAIGHQAFRNGNGNDNICIGALAMQNFTSSSSIGIGFRALENGTGTANISIGADAMRNYTGNNSVAIGGNSPLYSGSGIRNTAVGSQAMNSTSRTSGNNNTAIGARTILSSTTGSNNTAIGEAALSSVTSGSDNTAIGRQTFFSGNVNRGIAIGHRAGYYETQDDRLYITNQQGTNEANGRQRAIIYGVMSSTTANQILDLNAKVKPTFKPDTATVLAGYDANGYMANVSLGSNLNLSNGTLSASDTDNQLLSYNSTSGNLSISGGNTVNIPLFSTSSTTKGLVPGSNGASTQFLRGDGTWATPTLALSGGAANKVAFWTSATTLGNNSKFYWDNVNERLHIANSTFGTGLLNLEGMDGFGFSKAIEIINSSGWVNSWIKSFNNGAPLQRGVAFGGKTNINTDLDNLLVLNNYVNYGVGILKSYPLARLHIGEGDDSNANLRLDNSDANYYTEFNINSEGDLIIRNNSGHMTIGKNTSTVASINPSASLHIFAPATAGEDDLLKFERSGGFRTTVFSQFYNNGSDAGLKIKNQSNATLVRINEATQRVAIGASNPLAKLHVQGDLKVDNLSGTSAKLAGYTTDNIATAINLGNYLSLSSNILSVSIPLFSTTTTTPGLTPGSNGATNQFLRGDGTWATPTATLSGGAANKVAFWTSSSTLSNNTNFHWNTSTESLGIGTASPQSKLHVNNTSSNFISTQGMTISHSNASVPFKALFSGSNSFQLTTGTPFANNGIYINNSGDNIGIRTSAPTTNLHVNGTARITGSTGTPTSIVGRDANGNISNLTLGTGLSITSGTLNASNSVQIDVYTTPGTYTWTKPTGAKAVYVKLIGGGGGGQGGYKYGSNVFTPGGGGGHGGGLSEYTYRANELPSSVTVVVGAGGAGGAGATANSTDGQVGNNGGNSSFHAVVAKGGSGGYFPNTNIIGYGITDDGSIGGRWEDTAPVNAKNTKIAAAGGGAGGAVGSSNVVLPPTANGTVMLFTGSYISPTIVGGDGGAGGAASTTGNGANGGTGSPGRFGAGGGGGGAARNGVGNGGNGGAGQGGAVLVITYF